MISCATPPSPILLSLSDPAPAYLFFTLPLAVLAKLACDLAAIQAIRNVSLVAVTQVATPPSALSPALSLSTQRKVSC